MLSDFCLPPFGAFFEVHVLGMAPSSPADGGDGPFDFDNIDLSENIADYLWGLLVVCGTGLQLVVGWSAGLDGYRRTFRER